VAERPLVSQAGFCHSFALRRVYENRVLRKIFLRGMEEAPGDCRLHNFSSPCLIGIIPRIIRIIQLRGL